MSPGRRSLRYLDELPTSVLEGVGPRKASALASMDIETVLDLLLHYPRRYVDRSHLLDIASAPVGEEVLISGTIRRVNVRRPRRGGRAIVDALVDDETGTITCTFFNQPWQAQKLRVGTEVAAFGKVDEYRGHKQLANPQLDVIGSDAERRTGKVIAIYPQSGKAGIGSIELARYLEEVLRRAREFEDPLPSAWLETLGLVDRTTAFRSVHTPPVWGDQLPARQRLKLDELLRLQLQLVIKKRALEEASRGITHAVAPGEGRSPGLVETFVGQLPFPLTGAQRKAIDEIAADLGGPCRCTASCRATWGPARRS